MLVFLCFLPLLALNIGWSFLENIDYYWKVREQHEVANQEIETLAAGSEFSYQFARLAGQFAKTFKAAAESGLAGDQLGQYANENARRVFRWPFPEYELFAFHVPPDGSNGDMLFMHSDLRPSRRLYVRAFEHLVRVSRNVDISGEIGRQNEKLLSRIIQNDAKSEVVARTQRGRSSFAFYRFYPHWFLWDYFEVPGQGYFGFFLFSRNDDERRIAARLLALRDLRDRSSSKGAFIPLYSGYGGAVVQAPLHRSKLFSGWARNFISPVEKDLPRWLQNGTPPVTRLGRYDVHSYLGKSQTHLTTLLMPAIEEPSRPLWLFVINIFLTSFLMLLLIRGIILGQWPEIGIRLRFILTYLLVASLPVSLLIISAYSYVTQYRQAIHFQSVTGLQSCLRQFDARKSQVNDEYRAAFAEMADDGLLQKLLATNGAESPEASARILSFFEGRAEPLPLLSFAIFDEDGKGSRFYSRHSKSEADPAIEAFRYPIVQMLRRKIAIYEPDRVFAPLKMSGIQETSLEAYKSMTTNDLIDEVDKRRSFPISRQSGTKIATQIHELVKIDGRERFAIFLVWDDQALDEKIFQQSVNHFGLNSPEYIFLAYRVNPQGLEPIGLPGRDADAEIVGHARQLAEQAYFRGSYVGTRAENLSLVAIPSKKYANTVLVGATRHHELEQSVASRLFFFAGLLVAAAFIVVFCAYMSARIILDPITGLRSALDRVAAGNLNIEITSRSQDELGILCQEFSTMTRGLREREKLATLLSDQAVEAISRADATGKLSGESFSGVALVSDIRNFTGLCEEHPPDAITEMLNEHFARMTDIISGQGGRIYKFIGDAIEAVFPEDDTLAESASERAFRAASLMLLRLRSINARRAAHARFNYRIGVGLAYGQMHSGSIGSVETRLDYAILGEPLKTAARLEALSPINPAFPLIVDEVIVNSLPESGLTFIRLENSSHQVAYSLSAIGETLPERVVGEEKSLSLPISALPDTATSQLNTVEAGGGSGLTSAWAFILGAMMVIMLAVGAVFGWQTVVDARKNAEKVVAVAENLRLIEQLKCDAGVRTGFEADCFRIVGGIEKLLEKADSLSDKQLAAAARSEILAHASDKAHPGKFAVFLYDHASVNSDKAVVDKLLVAEGWNSKHLQALQAEVEYRRRLDFSSWKHAIPNSASPAIKEIFGNQISQVVLHREMFCRASEVPCNGSQHYFYWDYLTTDSDDAPAGSEAESTTENVRAVRGMIMLAVEVEPIKQSLALRLTSYQQPDKAIALIDGSGTMQLSPNFPPQLASYLAVGKALPAVDRFVVNEDELKIGRKSHRLLVCHLTQQTSIILPTAVVSVIACLLLCYWYKTVRGNTPASRSLAARLWLLLLLSAVVPLVTVFFVLNLFLNEDYSVRVSQARADLNRTNDLFELRESFVDPLAWKFVRERTFSAPMQQLAAELELASGTANMKRLDKLVSAWYSQHKTSDPLIINYNPRDIAVAGKNGWEYATSGTSSGETNTFGVMLKQIARSIMVRRVQGTVVREGLDAAAIEGELVVETGLQTVRSLFGDDVYVKLANGIGLPVLMNVVSGTAGLIIHAVPDIENPEYVMIWLIMFDYEGYLARIAASYRGDCLLWPVEAHRYGNVFRKEYYQSRHEIVKMASWIAGANLPVSGRIYHKGAWYLAEGRPGVAQITSLLVGMAPEAPIDKAMARSKAAFTLLMAGILLCILFIAKNVADDILIPIRSLISAMQQVVRENYSFRIESGRTDELGVLCSSFDSMTRGLEEKRLMGRMLSKSAQKFSLQESDIDGRRMEFALLYVGIPSFEAWMASASKESLFVDLREQVTMLSKIIIAAGGDIDKIIGEKILAVFHSENNPAEAVAAACRASMHINAAEGRGALPFPAATAINYGSVIAGFLGVGGKRDFTIIGDAVNVTARIEAQAETMRYQRCLASEAVLDLLPPDVLAREHGEVELKGKAKPMKLYQLTATGNSLIVY